MFVLVGVTRTSSVLYNKTKITILKVHLIVHVLCLAISGIKWRCDIHVDACILFFKRNVDSLIHLFYFCPSVLWTFEDLLSITLDRAPAFFFWFCLLYIGSTQSPGLFLLVLSVIHRYYTEPWPFSADFVCYTSVVHRAPAFFFWFCLLYIGTTQSPGLFLLVLSVIHQSTIQPHNKVLTIL